MSHFSDTDHFEVENWDIERFESMNNFYYNTSVWCFLHEKWRNEVRDKKQDRRVVSRVQVAFFKGRKKGVEISLRKFDRPRGILITQRRFEVVQKVD